MKTLFELKAKPNDLPGFSTVGSIVYNLLMADKQQNMLTRLQIKLGKTKEEIYQIVSEL